RSSVASTSSSESVSSRIVDSCDSRTWAGSGCCTSSPDASSGSLMSADGGMPLHSYAIKILVHRDAVGPDVEDRPSGDDAELDKGIMLEEVYYSNRYRN